MSDRVTKVGDSSFLSLLELPHETVRLPFYHLFLCFPFSPGYLLKMEKIGYFSHNEKTDPRDIDIRRKS